MTRPSKSGDAEPRSFEIAEEGGLVWISLPAAKRDAKARRASGAGLRIRFNPPSALLREDDRLFDLAHVEPFVTTSLAGLVEGLLWTDTVVGIGRVSLGYGFSTPDQARAEKKRLQKALRSVDLGAWALEDLEVVTDNRARLDRLDTLADSYAAGEPKPDPKFARALASFARPAEGLVARCGLDKRNPSLKAVRAGLKWLDGQLAALEPLVLKAAKPPEDGFTLQATINMHPQQRRVTFELVKHHATVGDDIHDLTEGQHRVLEDLLGAPRSVVRRLCGICFNGPIDKIAGARRVVIDMEN